MMSIRTIPVCILAFLLSHPFVGGQSLTLQAAIDAYAAGDVNAPANWVRSPAGASMLRDLGMGRAKLGSWSRVRAGFWLEVAASLTGTQAFRSRAVLTAGRELVIERPAEFGVDPVEDRFEVLWHQIAIGLSQASQSSRMQLEYLSVVIPRFESAAARRAQIVTRLPLARGIATAALCCSSGLPNATAVVTISNEAKPSGDEAIRQFRRAAEVPSLKHEALLRGAVLLRHLGRHEQALEWLDRIPAQGDPDLIYVHYLTRGSVLGALDRPAEAAEAYAAAVRHAPAGQRAATGLAASLLRAGKVEEAVRAAEKARQIASGLADTFVYFHRADARFVQPWLAELRSLLR